MKWFHATVRNAISIISEKNSKNISNLKQNSSIDLADQIIESLASKEAGDYSLTFMNRIIYENTPSSDDDRVSYEKVAATYSPTWWGSTIGDGELNFSVRNGKRWILTAITATVCF